MKRLTLAGLALVLAASFCISCDAMADNVFEKSGLVEADTSSVDEVAKQSQATKTVSSDDVIDALFDKYATDVKKISGYSNITIVTKLDDEEYETLVGSLSKAMASDSGRDKLKDELASTALTDAQKGAVSGSVTLLHQAVEAFQGDLEQEIKDEGTRNVVHSVLGQLASIKKPAPATVGDLLIVQMLTNTLSNAARQCATLYREGEDAAEEQTYVHCGLDLLAGLQNIQNLAELVSGENKNYLSSLTVASLLEDLQGGEE